MIKIFHNVTFGKQWWYAVFSPFVCITEGIINILLLPFRKRVLIKYEFSKFAVSRMDDCDKK